MSWNEQDHPRDEDGKFTIKNGTATTDTLKERMTNLLFKNTKNQEIQKQSAQKKKNILLDILGKKATHADVLYGTEESLEKKINEFNDNPTGYAADIPLPRKNVNTGDSGFDKSPWHIEHYYKLSKEYDKEVGDFLQKNTTNPKYYSNDIRHQYVSAIFARNLGENIAKIMGELNEIKDIQSEPGDSDIDRINNEIGRKYAKLYPDMPRQELLKLMLKDHSKNQKLRIQKMREKNQNNLDNVYM